MYPCVIEYEGYVYKSVEHAYVSAKSDSINFKEKVRSLESPYYSKNLGSELERGNLIINGEQIKMVDNWATKKLGIMEILLIKKFHIPELKELLLNTNNREIFEGNTWNCVFWGVDHETGYGENHLGRLIMKTRANLQPQIF